MDDIEIITLTDEETGEELELALVDAFEYKGRAFSVLITVDTPDDETELYILEEVEDENGEILFASIEESEEDEIFEFYDQLCEESLEDDETSAEE